MSILLEIRRRIVFFMFVLTVLFPAADAAENEKSGFTLAARRPDGWIVNYTPTAAPYSILELEGKRHLLFEGRPQLDRAKDHTGEPLLPVDALTFGVPQHATLHVEILDPVYELAERQLVAPYPEYVLNDVNDLVPVYKKNPLAYSRTMYYPSQEYVVDPLAQVRDQIMATVRISPYRYNPAANILQRLVRATLRISVRDERGAPMTLPQGTTAALDPFFEHTFREMLFNYDEARSWRVTPSAESTVRTPVDSTRDWFETGKPYYRIPITENGWYKVTKAQLVAAGANPSLIDVASLKMFLRGVQIPIVVRPDTSVEFYGRRNYGDSTYTDFYTDTSAYWLTWGGTAGLRFTPSFVDSVGVVEQSASSVVTRHFEENNYYFQGTETSDVINMETTPGEGWAWGVFSEWFFPGATREYPFTLDHLDTSAANATLRIRVVSTTPNFVTPNHRVRFWLNDVVSQPPRADVVWEFTFGGRSSIVYSLSFPRSLLVEGTNVLKMQSIPTGASPNQFYLDWFEIDYARYLRPPGADQLLVTVPAPGSTTRTTFRASRFTTPHVEVFDLFSQRRITSIGVEFGGGEGYLVSFRDSMSTARSYVVVGAGGALPVSSVTQKLFSDIRVNATGADYIIITHRNFLAAAQQLAAHRQARNGVRTAIIDVQDIYDEFNYGVLNATTLKAFMRHAYDTWPQPRPSTLLLFGDASWDYHKFYANSINTNYVPSYGVPASDNWFVAFRSDTTVFPSMFVGRIPVKDAAQAQHAVQKIIGYDSYTLSEWNKRYLFVAGLSFAPISDILINTRVTPPPLGGIALRAYKTTQGVIDGEHKARMKQIVRDGIVYLNFVGHSGGRVWEVDIGPPAELENTNGMLPFVSSVSCNVGAFADPLSLVLAEDFVLADNRGAIGAWASSTLGYPTPWGYTLQSDFLQGLRDSVRQFGALTTNAKIRMLRLFGLDLITLSNINCNNLLGDPLTEMAIPLKPDLAVKAADVVPDNLTPSVNDSLVTFKVKVFNYGLVTVDSVGLTVTDTYSGQTTSLLNNKKLAPMRQTDSVLVSWRAMDQVGPHTIAVQLDPLNQIPEVSELNNVTSRDQYVYANLLSVVKPIRNMVVLPGVQRLVVTSPFGVDSSGFFYEFELDTVDTFDSPALVASGPVAPTAVTGEWSTPSLANNTVYFWRARTAYGPTLGKWEESSFSTSSTLPALPAVLWREKSARQFKRDVLVKTAATDSGVTIAPTPPINLYVRSVGNRYNQLAEYYSTIRINEQKISGYWWEVGNSFLVARINDFSGAIEFRTYNLLTFPADSGQREAQRMTDFLNQTPVGSYIAWSVIFDGSTNVSESLYVAMERLGSTLARTILPDMSWAFIGRKGVGGPGMVALESATTDTAVVSTVIHNYYGAGNGSVASPPMAIPTSWHSFQWQQSGVPATNTRIAFLGIRSSGAVDTLRIFPKDSTSIDLRFLNGLTSGDRYKTAKVAGLLSTSEPLVTPTLGEWQMEMNAPADLAISARTVSGAAPASTRNIEITVYNVGYQDSDSSTVVLSVYDRQNKARTLASVSVLPIALGASRTVTIPISTTNLPRRATVQATVVPAKRAKDLVHENNTAYYSFDVPPALSDANVRVYADGAQIMDGDYVPAAPLLALTLPKTTEYPPARTEVQLLVNNRRVETWISSAEKADDRPVFTPRFTDGSHLLTFKVATVNVYGDVDTMESTLNVRVESELRIREVSNYPNPFSRDTYFTFLLSTSAEELVLRIFTVAGRKIREMVVPAGALRVGFNRIYWDGLDADGDEVANGYYFYQISIKGEGKTQSEIQKLVKLR